MWYVEYSTDIVGGRSIVFVTIKCRATMYFLSFVDCTEDSCTFIFGAGFIVKCQLSGISRVEC